MADEREKKDYKEKLKATLNLPKTEFPIRAHAAQEDPILLERWQRENMYEKTFVKNREIREQKSFILHDGPPYANGAIHLGHAYNKIVKDIFTKAARMSGAYVPVTPGWDCHGLPIELKVASENPGLSPEALKKKCR